MTDGKRYYLHMYANKAEFIRVKQELANSSAVQKCAVRHNTVGDLSSMKVCYLLRHYPNLSVGEIADLVGLSISATSRCLTKLKAADIVISQKKAQTVRYQLNSNSFTSQLIAELENQV